MRLSPLAAAHRPGHGVGGRAESVQDRGGVEVGGEQELRHLLLHVRPQPRHRGELGPVRLLVQAHPPAEVVRVDVQLALDHDDVGRDQRQPAGRGVAARRVRVGRQEQLVLAEHAARQVGQDQPGLHPGHAGADGRDDRARPAARCRSRPCAARADRARPGSRRRSPGSSPAGPRPPPGRRQASRAGRSARAPARPPRPASSRSSATTFLASAMLTCGPGLTQRTPVDVATCQSII